ncbi:aldehyde dehydrogenase family protein [Acidiluteibacter ferrifornacis]|uniref:Aldehyde dehydrogenase family protein n=1 Tax=Acidiluteibacter ferrifornacis TaxID=2692424 RepID=A0A6N9NKA2_9FLAO|nr:aldehyde dehydrogenase family protein [Acidiluteibacter ferrifornacis]NBG67126.1 aldehyde dehydrogenase family protein [Acidiluteibacter ferrifornacis]
MKNYQSNNYIAGKWEPKGTGEFQVILDKYQGTEIGKIPQASEEQMEAAIVAANEAFEITKKWSAGKRAEMMQKLYDKLKERKDEFINIIINEGGKPRSYATNEVDRSLTTLRLAVEEATRFGGEVVPMDWGAGEGKTAFTKRFPIGVIACITPFNFPLNLVMHKVAPALATGCTTIIKPAPQAPMSCLAFAALMEEVGYPAGAINVLVCDIPVAEKLVKDERVAKLSFTGSDKVGWYLKSICGKKKVTLELGGNASVIVDEDVNVESITDLVAKGAYLYAGQICISTQRIFVHAKVFDRFQSAFIASIQKLKVGDAQDNEVLVGPVIDKGHLNRINDWVQEAKQKGAQVILGGAVLSEQHNLYEPTLITNSNSSMKVAAEEVFGPVAVLEKANSFEEAIKMTNDSKYGLQVGVFTNSLKNFKYATEELEVGGVIMNNIPGFRIDHMPYGGVKDSGLGREGIKYAMEEMTEGRLIVY